MLDFRSRQIVVTATIIILSALFVSTGCQTDEQITPVYVPVAAPPVEATIDQVLSDYTSDEVAADIKYGGKRLLFTNLEITKVNVNLIEDYSIPIVHIVSNGVEFRPKFDIDTNFVREGFIVDIIGEVYGWYGVVDRYLVVENCWVKIIEGEAGYTSDMEEIY
ncbi:hypothetical protein ACFLYB_02510 [Chloroflexota bacterium]